MKIGSLDMDHSRCIAKFTIAKTQCLSLDNGPMALIQIMLKVFSCENVKQSPET